MLIQYSTGIIALVLVALHLLQHGIIVPYGVSLAFQNVLNSYKSIINASLLELLLIVILVHGFNGLRVILLEWRQGKAWTKHVNTLIVTAIAITIVYGTKTVILAASAMH